MKSTWKSAKVMDTFLHFKRLKVRKKTATLKLTVKDTIRMVRQPETASSFLVEALSD